MTFCGKQRFSDPEDAREFMRHLRGLGKLRKHSTVYYCDPCMAYHFGRIPKDAFSVLGFVKLYTKERHECPPLEEVMIGCGLSFTKVQRAVFVLKEYGWLRPEFENRLVLSTKHITPKEISWMEKN